MTPRVTQQRFAAMPRHPCRGRLRPGRDARPVVRIVSCSSVVRFVYGGDGKSARWADEYVVQRDKTAAYRRIEA